jgi:hypothetical protein
MRVRSRHSRRSVPTSRSANTFDTWLPEWSPDGTRIAYEDWSDGDSEIYVMDPDGSNVVRLTDKAVQEIGIGPFVAAKIIGEVGNVRRLRSRTSFAMLNGSAPKSASSGQISRHRLNRGGKGQLNMALHVIAINRLRLDPKSRAYVARKCAEGKSKKEAIRCLKRRISDVVYRRLVADVQADLMS